MIICHFGMRHAHEQSSVTPIITVEQSYFEIYHGTPSPGKTLSMINRSLMWCRIIFNARSISDSKNHVGDQKQTNYVGFSIGNAGCARSVFLRRFNLFPRFSPLIVLHQMHYVLYEEEHGVGHALGELRTACFLHI